MRARGLAHTASWVTEQSPGWQCPHVWEAPVSTERTSVGLDVQRTISGRGGGRWRHWWGVPDAQQDVLKAGRRTKQSFPGLWLPDMIGALPTTVRSASRFTILDAAEMPYGSCVTPLLDRRGAGAV